LLKLKNYPCLFTRIGAKNGLCGQIIADSLWREGIDTYIEPFGGSFGVGRLSAPFPKEIYSDIDYMPFTAVSMFAKYGTSILLYILEHMDYTEATFKRLRSDMEQSEASFKEYGKHTILDEIQRGATALALSHLSLNGNFKYYRNDLTPLLFEKQISARLYLVERFEGLTCLHMDAFELIKKHKDDKSVMLMLDPPYPKEKNNSMRTTNKLYKHDMVTPEGHLELLNLVANSQAKVLICSYRTDLYDDFFADKPWYSYDICHTKKSSFVGKVGHKKPDAIETIYTNYIVGGDSGFGMVADGRYTA